MIGFFSVCFIVATSFIGVAHAAAGSEVAEIHRVSTESGGYRIQVIDTVFADGSSMRQVVLTPIGAKDGTGKIEAEDEDGDGSWDRIVRWGAMLSDDKNWSSDAEPSEGRAFDPAELDAVRSRLDSAVFALQVGERVAANS